MGLCTSSACSNVSIQAWYPDGLSHDVFKDFTGGKLQPSLHRCSPLVCFHLLQSLFHMAASLLLEWPRRYPFGVRRAQLSAFLRCPPNAWRASAGTQRLQTGFRQAVRSNTNNQCCLHTNAQGGMGCSQPQQLCVRDNYLFKVIISFKTYLAAPQKTMCFVAVSVRAADNCNLPLGLIACGPSTIFSMQRPWQHAHIFHAIN